jgi:predicted TPR repeat methyltransferase
MVLADVGRWSETIAPAEMLLTLSPDSIIGATTLAKALLAGNRLDEANDRLEPLIALHPENFDLRLTQTLVLLKQLRLMEALAAADRTVALDPKSVAAHRTRALILMELHQPSLAVLSFLRALAEDGADVESFIGLGAAEAALDDYYRAAKYVRRALVYDPGNVVAGHLLAAWGGKTSSAYATDYARRLFDRMAPAFDYYTTATLGYRTPQDAVRLLQSVAPDRDRFKSLLDLGCGTGLAVIALALRYAFARRTGVDISSGMLAIAKRRRLYHDLREGDIKTVLPGLDAHFDLIVALDVLPYIDGIEPIFTEVARRLTPGGMLVYSIETCIDENAMLARTGRFQHARAYIDAIAARHGLKAVAGSHIVLRKEKRTSVPGYLGILTRA